ncbi:ATP-dependent zinc metalloprotease FTSH 4, mitochondrial-like [Vigna radiata var. radiata]|uniref:ATP-dependent zinc metalloprotease FTSH 4, mitochondrial-like n=1 Tax=Vigna radiata var. radiata TaxID=3916 RepID=A0A1S3UBJ4_VIGRR|nr:ATP-dependent zinc metalloprotease FTSH 4, mitochondrial-like [Vigna radiata var. radiata]
MALRFSISQASFTPQFSTSFVNLRYGDCIRIDFSLLRYTVARRQSKFGRIQSVFARSYFSVNNFGNRPGIVLGAQERFQSRYFGSISRQVRDAVEATKVAYLKELYRRNDPEAVIREFESQPSLHNTSAVSEYVKAVVQVDRLDKTELMKTFKRGMSKSVASEEETAAGLFALRNLGKSRKENIFGTSSNPIHTVARGRWNIKEEIWTTFRIFLYTFIVMCGLAALYEDSGIRKGLGINETLTPVMETNTKFSDVKGVDEAKAELEEIVQYLRDPKRFTRLGGKLPKGVLLVGPPGTGKTMLARAIAGEAGVPFFCSSGSEFDELYIGVGARRVRDLFSEARKVAPCIIFIDEIDAMGGKRNPLESNWRRMTLNQLLIELDGFKPNEGIILIGATNFPESLDDALVRPGRFDRKVEVPNPDVRGRQQILESHMSKVVTDADVDLKIIARGTPGFSGADLANLINMAAIRAAMNDSKAVTMADLEHSREKILMGSELKSTVVSEATRKLTAFHEGGRALVAIYTDGADPVHKATIVPTATSLGRVRQLPDDDKQSVSRKEILAWIDVCMAGWAAEELIFGEVSSTVSFELKQATRAARMMVTKYGMGNEVGPVTHEYNDKGRSMSSETRLLIEKEVKQLVERGYNNAKTILTTHSKEHHALANALLEHETLTGTQIKTLLAEVRAQMEQQQQHLQTVEAQSSSQSSTVPPSSSC